MKEDGIIEGGCAVNAKATEDEPPRLRQTGPPSPYAKVRFWKRIPDSRYLKPML
jgi:hypothetical protein